MVLCTAGSSWAKIVYVKLNGLDTNNGLSWQEAVQTIQVAVALADPDDQIWVAGGTYTLSAQILVDKAVGLYGGFAGGETDLNQRDWQNNTTTVDGQDSVNCFTVTADATIDGFSITKGFGVYDGWGDLRGGAIYHPSASLTVVNCNFFENIQADYGGAINSESDGSLLITESDFKDNEAYYGGGALINTSATASIMNSTFSRNSVYYWEAGCGAISSGSNPRSRVAPLQVIIRALEVQYV